MDKDVHVKAVNNSTQIRGSREGGSVIVQKGRHFDTDSITASGNVQGAAVQCVGCCWVTVHGNITSLKG